MITEAPVRAVRLLDVEADLGADFDAATFAQAREQIISPLITLAPGDWTTAEVAAHPSVSGELLGAIIVAGLSVREAVLAGRACTHLHGPGDLIAYHEEPAALPLELSHTVPVPTELVLLDDRFLAASRRWPRLSARLFDLASQQIRRASTHQAISQLPRVEDRLVALFWHLADRWGHVRADGIFIGLPLTHEALGRLVGARRPTVSLGLRTLAESGALRRTANGDWRLDPGSIDAFAHEGARPPAAAVLSFRPVTGQPHPVAATHAAPERAALLDRVAALRAEHRDRCDRTAEVLARNAETRTRSQFRREQLAKIVAA